VTRLGAIRALCCRATAPSRGRDTRVAFAAAVTDLATFAARWPSALRALITGRFAPGEAPALLSGSAPGIKNVVTFG
jgi:hypothetical protein